MNSASLKQAAERRPDLGVLLWNAVLGRDDLDEKQVDLWRAIPEGWGKADLRDSGLGAVQRQLTATGRGLRVCHRGLAEARYCAVRSSSPAADCDAAREHAITKRTADLAGPRRAVGTGKDWREPIRGDRAIQM